VGSAGNDKLVALKVGESFRDLDVGPELVLVPPGEFMMGEKGSQHKVTIGYPLLVGKFPVTFAEWDAAVAAGGVTHTPADQGWGRGRRPVMNVSWDDAKAYTAWLSKSPGQAYRLLTEAEWEYCCRAGTATTYSFGDKISKAQAQFSEGKWGSAKQTVEVGKFPANAFGLHDLHGNVWEWCEDPWHDSYAGAPADGSVWAQGGDATKRVLRGGSWYNYPENLRSALRFRLAADFRGSSGGFRVARSVSR
jgi:formylglycine-generating enzyme required for sulfatase activity